MDTRIDPAELSIAGALFSSVADEMGVTLGRTAHSPNIKERRDYSCAVFDPRSRLVAQAAHIPVHLGAMPESVAAAMPLAPFAPGDIVILNDPYLGGTHLPDITMVSPVFAEADSPNPNPPGRSKPRPYGVLVGFLASRAHHADVGGISPGSMPIAEELIQEGVVIPPIKLYEAGHINQSVLDLLLRNMRAPHERRGDLDAQIAAHRTGESRLREIAQRYGVKRAWRLMDELMDYAERMTRAAIAAVPDGVYEFEDFLDDDGVSG
ncbi:MAG TPA: hydantoinase B/oxoprolinase family protein, partial [Dehalococcoidia bacterium]|nr:hydantoinase B/oxoprolinase family protein [Dehalococcoidia bacterium]